MPGFGVRSPLAGSLLAAGFFLAGTRSPGTFPPARPVADTISPRSLAAALDPLVPRLLDSGDVPGLAIAVVGDGSLLWKKAYGVADAASRAPLRDDALFEAASLSKPVFAYLVMKLVDAGTIDLDRPIGKYLPGDYSSDPRVAAITPRQVLSHTTGLPNWRNGRELATHFPPGERFSYSGEGFVYLQKAVERVTGQTLDALSRRLVFGPLEMTDSAYVWEERFEGRRATGHDGAGTRNPPRRPAEAFAAASLLTTPADYAKFLAAILEGRGLAEATSVEMLRPQVRVDEGCSNCIAGTPTGRLSRELAWGLGWGLEETGDGLAIWHWGDNSSGYHGFVVGYPRRRLGAVVFTNGLGGHGIIPDVVEAAIGGRHPAFAWIDYERWDSPSRTLYHAILAEGDAALRRYRATHAAGDGRLTESQMNRIGYWLLAKKRTKDAAAVFETNTQDFPKSANVWDSLGEAYAADGQRERAVAAYRRSLELDPSNGNASQALQKLATDARKPGS